MPPVRAFEPPHDGAVLLLKPLSGVFDTVSRSHFDRSRMAARLKSRFALDTGVDFLSRLFERTEAKVDGSTSDVPQDTWATCKAQIVNVYSLGYAGAAVA